MSIRALDLAPHLYRAVASLSGYWMDHNYTDFEAPSKISRTLKSDGPLAKSTIKEILPRIMIAHGKQDRVVPFTEAKKLYSTFTHKGYLVKFLPFNGAHRIPKKVIQNLIEFLSHAFNSKY